MAIIALCGSVAASTGCPECFNPANVNSRHAAVGANTDTSRGRVKRGRGAANNWRSIFGDGRRGVQERNCASNGFRSFMRLSFQAGPEFFQAITISPRRRIRRQLQQFSDLFKSMVMPQFQYDHLALGDRQFRQAPHRGAFGGGFIRGPLEPPARFKLPREPAPERPAIIQRAIPKTAHTIMLRLLRCVGRLQQRQKRFLHHILGFRVRKPQRPTIKDQFGRFGVIQFFAPRRCRPIIHSPHRHHRWGICIKNFRS